ncbi:MAG: rubrerythrin family protein [Planctomycetota bacterium]
MSTNDNLAAAFAGESQANRKYTAFAKQADKDGFAQVAKLFRAAAAAETVHALAHLRAMGGIRTTAENLAEAAEGERYEYEEMYPPFVEEAKAEGHKRGTISMTHAMAVEKIHHDLYQAALAAVRDGGDLDGAKIWVCDVCGNTFVGEHPEKCPICGVPHSKFTEVD